MAPKKSAVVFDEWDTYIRETDDGPVFISFDVEAASSDLTHTLRHSGRVVIRIHNPGPSGRPVEQENERLWELEDELCETLSTFGVACRLVGRLTHQGLLVLVYQLDNWEAFRSVCLAWAEECQDYPIQLSDSAGWEFFDECIRPLPEDWLFMADSRVIHNLIESGSDPDKEHALEFVFQGKPADLERVKDSLQGEGYEALSGRDPKDGEIVMVRKMTLDMRAITAESLRLAQLAEEQGVTYDGWGAAVVE